MHDLIRQLVVYIRGILRYRWWMLSVAWVVCIVGWLVVANLPDQYRASAKVFVDTNSLLKPLLRGLAVQTNEQHRIRLMTKTLLSRPNLEKVTRMTDLDLKAKTPEEMEQLLDELKRDIEFRGAGGRRDNMYSIGYTSEDPELAKLIVKSLLTIFVESNLGESRKEQDTAHQFLEQQIEEYEARLLEAENSLAAFKQQNMGFMSGSADGYYQRLGSMKDQLQSANLQLKIQRDRMKVLKQQLEGEVPTFGLVQQDYLNDPGVIAATSETENRIKNLNLKLDELLIRYTDQHPDVTAIQQTIKTLKEKLAKDEADAIKVAEEQAALEPDAPPPVELERNVVYQQMKMAYSAAEAEVAAKQAVVSEYTRRIEVLESAVDRVLKVEAEKAQLNRDYSTVKKNYTELVARLESARMARKVDTRTDAVKFRVIEPPRVPHEPSGPNRILLSSGVFAVGLGLGLALAFLMSQLRPTFDDRRIMGELTGLPVLGSVDMVWTEVQRKGRASRGLVFSVVFLGLVATYGAVLSLYLLDIDIGLQTEEMRSIYDKIRAYISFESLINMANSKV
ncbi:MAG: hypothetical protein L3J26_01125 [Candidatus Polarisedimenticolaceae bacterium]|nr:hypothetical protein [Candidatus Polarisedimenticolaceae bacterium]